MSDLTPEALDALQERLKAHDSHPESASAQADAAIAALRAERDALKLALDIVVKEPNKAKVKRLISERDALRAQLATAQNEAARARMTLQAVKAYEAGEPSQPPVTGMPKRALIDTPTPSAPSPTTEGEI
jgi:septal ring factor EnvC (AmiA/AmiB activator)